MPTLTQLSKDPRILKKRTNRFKALLKAPQRRAVVYKISIVSPRKPNSARRRVAKAHVTINMRRVFCKIPGIGNHNLYKYAIVWFEGRSPKDTPGVNYTLMRGKEDFTASEKINRVRRRSRYCLKKP